MAEVTKYQLITNNNNNNNIISDLKTHFSFFKTTKSTSFIYAVVLIFILFTVFLAFSPSSSSTSSSPWFVNIFTVNSTSPTDLPDRSQINPFRSQNNATFQPPLSQNLNNSQLSPDKVANFEHNNNQNSSFTPEIPQILENNMVIQPKKQMNDSISDVLPQISPLQSNQSSQLSGNQSIIHQIDKDSEVSSQISPLINNQTTGEVLPQITSKSRNNGSEVLPQIPPSNQSQNVSDVLGNNGSEVSPQISQLTKNQSVSEILPQIAPNSGNQGSENSTIKPQISTDLTKKGIGSEVNSSDLAASLSKNQGMSRSNDTVSESRVKKQGNEIEELVGCDLYDGGWIRDESYPLYKPGSCKLVDEQFNCVLNGRPDNDYYKLKWKPKGCSLPRLNGGNMLKLLKGKRLVFVGDSLNRNMWESLVCILKSSVKNKKKVFEAFGRHHFRTEASYSFVFKDYNCTVEFFVAPFLVQQWEVKDKNGTTQETLRLDLMVSDADQYKNADYIIFNTGHWWTHDKTSKGEDYYQEGSHVYKQLAVTEAFRKAITTWTRWVDANINPQRTHVLFRGYSASHFRGGQWNSGGQCDSETEPIKNETYLTKYPWKMKMFESVIKGMKTPVSFLNVTRLTDYRKDGHPSVYRKQHLSSVEKKSPLRYQDCSHWCLPGVPDSWNELLYAELLRKQYLDKKAKNKT
ncbi:protein trichome birefringence-like 1 [Silene latifolia]|uniref:protein trichome birefringence-like 1 n=1 Tax=Silene latifolia TaxID=37657 RepID=UPI003D787194